MLLTKWNNQAVFSKGSLRIQGLALLILLGSLACSPTKPVSSLSAPMKGVPVLQSVASWYGPGFQGRKTASGERYNMYDLTAAHKTFPFGTRLLLTNPSNHLQTIVRINDRGPYIGGRDIDLSYAAAKNLGLINQGVTRLFVQVLPVDKNQVVALAGFKKVEKAPLVRGQS